MLQQQKEPTVTFTFDNIEIQRVIDYVSSRPYKEVHDIMNIFLGKKGVPIVKQEPDNMDTQK